MRLLIALSLLASITTANARPMLYEPSELDYELCARTVWGEARSQSRAEQAAVIHVIFNRWLTGRWGKSVENVVFARWQFSTWNAGDPNRDVAADPHAARFKKFRAIKIACRLIFEARLAGEMHDPTEHACFYWHGETWPRWAVTARYAKIGAMRLIHCRGSY